MFEQYWFVPNHIHKAWKKKHSSYQRNFYWSGRTVTFIRHWWSESISLRLQTKIIVFAIRNRKVGEPRKREMISCNNSHRTSGRQRASIRSVQHLLRMPQNTTSTSMTDRIARILGRWVWLLEPWSMVEEASEESMSNFNTVNAFLLFIEVWLVKSRHHGSECMLFKSASLGRGLSLSCSLLGWRLVVQGNCCSMWLKENECLFYLFLDFLSRAPVGPCICMLVPLLQKSRESTHVMYSLLLKCDLLKTWTYSVTVYQKLSALEKLSAHSHILYLLNRFLIVFRSFCPPTALSPQRC